MDKRAQRDCVRRESQPILDVCCDVMRRRGAGENEAIVGHRIAEVSVHRFINDLAGTCDKRSLS
jgi:hypothetical protein